MITVYTQNNCPYCTLIIQKLTDWDVTFDVKNISMDEEAKSFLKDNGHKTVPVVYMDNFWINDNIDTEQFTEELFYDRIDVMISERSPEEIDQLLKKYEPDFKIPRI